MKSPEELLKADQENRNERDCCFGPFRLKPTERTLWGPPGAMPLTPKEFETLNVLVKNSGQPVSAETLLSQVWPDVSVDPNNVPQVIGRLRRKLGRNDAGQDYILTLPNVGYLLAATVGSGPPVAELDNPGAHSPESVVIVEPSGYSVRSPLRLSRGPLSIIIVLLIVLLVFVYLSFRGRGNRLLVWETANVTDDHRPKRGPVLFDGSRIWFEEEMDGGWRIVSVSAEGGDIIPLDVPLKDVHLQDIALNGSALLLSTGEGNNRTLWAWPLSGGTPQMLPPHAGDAAWTPDKGTIAFGTRNTLIVAQETKLPSTMTIAPSTLVRDPRWSPDGRLITFQLLDLETSVSRLWLSDRRGSHVRPVPGAKETGEDQGRGIWTRDGRYYLFVGGSPNRHDLWALSGPEGFFGSRFAKPSRLTHGPGNWDWPTPGRNTDELFAMGESIRGKLVSLAHRGTIWRPYLGGIPAYELDFSRDGKWVVYTRYPDHTLWKSKVDGSQRVQLTSPDVEAHQPHWSPDGARIAFMGQKAGAKWRVMILTPNGKTEEPFPEGADQGVPTWSSDGRALLYGDWLYRKNSTPMGLHDLDLFTHSVAPKRGSENLWTPRWSPDGAYICALRPDSTSLVLNRAGQSSWHEIMTGVDLDNPAWSSDSKYIYLTVQSSQLHRVNVLTGKVEPLADIHDFPITHERWFGVAPDGSPLALQGVPEQEIYFLRWVLP